MLSFPGYASAHVSTQVHPHNAVTIAIKTSTELAEKVHNNTLTTQEEKDLAQRADQAYKAIATNTDATTPVKFATNTYSATDNTLYLGAEEAATTYALTKVTADQSTRTLTPVALAPEKTNLNGAADTTNPVYDTTPSALAMMGVNPVVALPDNTNDTGLNRVILVTDTAAGGTIYSNATNPIKDAADTPLAAKRPIAAIAATDATTGTIYTAVPASAGAFGATNSGIVRLKKTNATDTPASQLGVEKLDGSGFGDSAAYKIDLTAVKPAAYTEPLSSSVNFAFSADPTEYLASVTLGTTVDLHWSPSMQEIYTGLTGITGVAGGTNSTGSIVSTVLGYVDDGKLYYYPIVNPDVASALGVDEIDHGVAFHLEDTTKEPVSAFKVRTMQTSTHKDYIIINGGIGDPVNTKTYLFSFPIVPTSDTNDWGMIANKPDGANPYVTADAAHFPSVNDSYTWIGSNGLVPADEIKDLRVVGDTVYAAVADDRSDTDHEAGIFASTALFDQYGNINAWTPWQRTDGNTDAVYGFGIDTHTDNFMYLTSADGTSAGDQTTIKSTFWGTSKDVGNTTADLSGTLATNFPLEKGGVHCMNSFGSTGDEPSLGFDNASLLVATGLDTVALVEAGQKNKAAVIALPSTAFTAGTTLRVDSTDVIKNIGPVITATMSNESTHNWLFIGGNNGIAVLSKPADGTGVEASLEKLETIADTTAYTFNKIELADDAIAAGIDFSRTRKIMSDGIYLYVMTQDALYVFVMDADYFTSIPTPIAAEDIYTYAVPGATLSDFVLTNRFIKGTGDTIAILATSKGLYTYDLDIEGSSPELVGDVGAVSQLNFIQATNNAIATDGNLYALAADMSQSTGKVYRYSVEDGVVAPIELYDANGTSLETNGKVGNLQKFRGNIAVDGSFIFDQCSKHFDDTHYLNMAPVTAPTSSHSIPLSTTGLTQSLDINTDDNTNVGRMVRDLASGAWIVPGDFGARVNQ